MSLNYNEVVRFMKEFEIDYLNRYDELIIDDHTNTYCNISQCLTIDEVKTRTVAAMTRPLGKGLGQKDAERLILRVNKYFNSNLTREDFRLMYTKLYYIDKLKEFESFIKRGFPMEELEGED